MALDGYRASLSVFDSLAAWGQDMPGTPDHATGISSVPIHAHRHILEARDGRITPLLEVEDAACWRELFIIRANVRRECCVSNNFCAEFARIAKKPSDARKNGA
jgi:hypothetical protein